MQNPQHVAKVIRQMMDDAHHKLQVSSGLSRSFLNAKCLYYFQFQRDQNIVQYKNDKYEYYNFIQNNAQNEPTRC